MARGRSVKGGHLWHACNEGPGGSEKRGGAQGRDERGKERGPGDEERKGKGNGQRRGRARQGNREEGRYMGRRVGDDGGRERAESGKGFGEALQGWRVAKGLGQQER